MRKLILATAATVALGITGCQRQPQEQQAPAGESAAPDTMQQPEAMPGQQPGEAPDTQEEVVPQDDTSGAQPMDDSASPGLDTGTDSSGQEPESAPSGQ